MGFIGPSITVSRNQTFVDPGALQSLFVPGGQIHTEGRKVQRTIRTQARSAAPVRSGLLRRSIVASQVGTIRYGVEFSVYAWANHALFVEDGTRGNGAGLIWGNPYMKLYGGGRIPPARWANSKGSVHTKVHGQQGQHFLRDGMLRGLAMHGYRP
jgi:hypothetical protein